MKNISEVALEMFTESQKMYVHNKLPHSFFAGYREVDFRGKLIKYESASMLILNRNEVNFSKEEWKELGSELNHLITSKNNDWLKTRNEYRILLEYMLCNHLDEKTLIQKCETPDFILNVDGLRVGIEITELTPCEQRIMDRIVDILHFEGPNASKLSTFPKNKFQIIPSHSQDSYYCKRLNADVCLEKDFVSNVALIKKKLGQYTALPHSLDKVIIVCDATRSFHITTRHECESLFDRLNNEDAIPNVEVEILYEDLENMMIQSAKWSEWRKQKHKN